MTLPECIAACVIVGVLFVGAVIGGIRFLASLDAKDYGDLEC